MGSYSDLSSLLPDDIELFDYSGKLVMPGFIDTHCHYPQTEMIASYGAQLLDWLEQYTFPTEAKFSDREYADGIASFSVMSCYETVRRLPVFSQLLIQNLLMRFLVRQKSAMEMIREK